MILAYFIYPAQCTGEAFLTSKNSWLLRTTTAWLTHTTRSSRQGYWTWMNPKTDLSCTFWSIILFYDWNNNILKKIRGTIFYQLAIDVKRVFFYIFNFSSSTRGHSWNIVKKMVLRNLIVVYWLKYSADFIFPSMHS